MSHESPQVLTAHLPTPTTSFVGRSEELASITGLLADPQCRLLTIIGPGGIGKTRLALQAAVDQIAYFADGSYFVPLTGVGSPDLIASAIANALAVSPNGAENHHDRVIQYLRQKQMLLLLDNFEHLLAGVDLLIDMLHAVSNVKLLVTSRERLNVQEEWTLVLEGLRVPESDVPDALAASSAVQLFVQRARQVQANFSLDDNAEWIAAICRQVEGMPLGLELAASWLRIFSCHQIADQMNNNLNFLATPLRNIPERHRNLRAVFEQSWQLLSDAERDVLMRLSVFRGGFDAEAAEQVAGATLPLLASLADKSLIRVIPAERYDLHELLRQFVADKLDQANQAVATADRHLDYFLKLAEQAETQVYGPDHTAWFDRLEVELDNLRTALTWAASGGAAESGLRLAGALAWFVQYRGYWREGITWLERMIAAAPEADSSVRTKALHRAGELCAMYGDISRGKRYSIESLALAQQMNDRRNTAWALAAVASAKFWAEGWRSNEVNALYDQCLALFREVDDRFGLGHILRRRASAALNAGDLAYARVLIEEALSRARADGDSNATAWSLCILGAVVWTQDQNIKLASTLWLESVELFREDKNLEEVCRPLVCLARVEQLTRNEAQAEALYEQMLSLMQQSQRYNDENAAAGLLGLGCLAATHGKFERAARLLSIPAQRLPNVFGLFSRADFERVVQSVRIRLGEAAFDAAWAEGQTMAWEQAVAYALHECRTSPETTTAHTNYTRLLVESLSPREREVLCLLAEGLSNREIAQKLVISIATVKVHAGNIYSKLGVTNRTQAVTQAQKLQLI